MRLFGVNIPDEKRVEIALTYVYGIGSTSSRAILKEVGIDSARRTKDLTQQEIAKIKGIIEKDYQIEGNLDSRYARTLIV